MSKMEITSVKLYTKVIAELKSFQTLIDNNILTFKDMQSWCGYINFIMTKLLDDIGDIWTFVEDQLKNTLTLDLSKKEKEDDDIYYERYV